MSEQTKLEPCPWCSQAPYRARNKVNPYAVCKTEGCFGLKMPVINLDDPLDVAAWNRRAEQLGWQEAIEAAAGAAKTEWFSGNRHRYASEVGPAIEARIRALQPPTTRSMIRSSGSNATDLRRPVAGTPTRKGFA